MPVAATQKISVGFGTGDGGKTYPIPVASQTQTPGVSAPASFADGFPALTRTPIADDGVPPSGEDMNGILYMATANLALICSGQPYGYDAAQSSAIGGYGLGAVLANAAGDGFWLSTVAGNTTDPDTGGAGWIPAWQTGDSTISLAGASGSVGLSTTVAAKPILIFTGSPASSTTVVLPNGYSAEWLLVNLTGATISLVLNGSAQPALVLPPGAKGQPAQAYSDGTDLWYITQSLSGYAPINSPSFTGAPLTPTPAASSNTTQIVNSAWVRGLLTSTLAAYATLASPTLSGNPTAPTAAPGTNNTLLATTAFVTAAIAALSAGVLPSFSNSAGVQKLLIPLAGGGTFQMIIGTVAQTGAGEIQNQVSSIPGSGFPTNCFALIAVPNGGTPMFVQSLTKNTYTWGTGYTGGRAATSMTVIAFGN